MRRWRRRFRHELHRLARISMISIDREKNYIVLSRCDYLYRDGKRDERANRTIGDGDIIIHLKPYFQDRRYDPRGDGGSAEIIVKEIAKRLRKLARLEAKERKVRRVKPQNTQNTRKKAKGRG